jgi:hypothetical protein
MARRAGAKYNENRAEIAENTGFAAQNDPFDQAVRSELATSGNNEIGVADQRKRRGPQGAKTTKRAGCEHSE